MTKEERPTIPMATGQALNNIELGFGNKAFGNMPNEGSPSLTPFGSGNGTTTLLPQTGYYNNNIIISKERSKQEVVCFSVPPETKQWLDSFAEHHGISRACVVRKLLIAAHQIALNPEMCNLPALKLQISEVGTQTDGIKREIYLEAFKTFEEKVHRLSMRRDDAGMRYAKENAAQLLHELTQLLPKIEPLDSMLEERIKALLDTLRKMKRGDSLE